METNKNVPTLNLLGDLASVGEFNELALFSLWQLNYAGKRDAMCR